jgi:hypothetical protein
MVATGSQLRRPALKGLSFTDCDLLVERADDRIAPRRRDVRLSQLAAQTRPALLQRHAFDRFEFGVHVCLWLRMILDPEPCRRRNKTPNYPLVRECLDNRANQKALADMRIVPPEGTVGMRCRVGGWTTDITAAWSSLG